MAPCGSSGLTAAVPKIPRNSSSISTCAFPRCGSHDILLKVDAATGFGDAFTTCGPERPVTRIGLLNVLLAEGLNLGLRKVAEASNTHDYWQLSAPVALPRRKRRYHQPCHAAQDDCPCPNSGAGVNRVQRWPVLSGCTARRAMNLINANTEMNPA
ncbi:Tn3 family transposase [Sinorhizobium meliloti]|uniref:Tn3 family transposase n=1 Tax=Rhizobium meliloti TaxID=382 RepID=UPI003BB1462B